MKKLLLPLLAASIPLGIMPAMAQSEAIVAAPSQDSEKAELLQTFASLYLAEDVTMASSLKAHDVQFLRAAKADAASVALDKQYPGIIDAAMAASRGATEASLRETMPLIKNEIAAFMDPIFTTSEVKAINAFYMSDEGKRLMRGMLDNLDTNKLADGMKERVLKDDDSGLLDKDELIAEAGTAAMKSMDAAIITALVKFNNTKSGSKFNAQANDLAAVMTDSMNNAMKTVAEKAQVATMTAVQQFMNDKAAQK
ncbi:MAG: hypothetical protein HC843_01345 [Sphingomonadales bacterium]|nr:hypothetical protein [Sphingomonadales bacterium]